MRTVGSRAAAVDGDSKESRERRSRKGGCDKQKMNVALSQAASYEKRPASVATRRAMASEVDAARSGGERKRSTCHATSQCARVGLPSALVLLFLLPRTRSLEPLQELVHLVEGLRLPICCVVRILSPYVVRLLEHNVLVVQLVEELFGQPLRPIGIAAVALHLEQAIALPFVLLRCLRAASVLFEKLFSPQDLLGQILDKLRRVPLRSWGPSPADCGRGVAQPARCSSYSPAPT